MARSPKKSQTAINSPKNKGKVLSDVIFSVIWVGASTIVSQLAVGYLMLWVIGYEEFTQPVWTAVYSALVYVLALILIVLFPHLIAKKRQKWSEFKTNRSELGLTGIPTWTDIGLAPVGFVFYLLLASIVVAIFSLFPWFDAEQVQNTGFNIYVMGLDRIIAFVTLVVVAPIAEEIIFRGWLYGKLREILINKVKDTWSMIISILLVSVLFGIVHLQWNVGINVFAMSVVLCGLREITGTIYSGIILHMLKNGVAFYLLYIRGMS